MGEDLQRLLEESFPEDRRAWITEAVVEAFRANQQLFDADIGHDAMSFGLSVYKSKAYFLSNAAQIDPGVTDVQLLPHFSMRVGRFQVSTFSGTGDQAGDAARCFPNNRLRAPLLAAENSRQFSFSFGNVAAVEEPLHVYLIHRGDPFGGLQGVFLGVPNGVDDKGVVNSYAAILPLWEDGEASVFDRSKSSRPVPVKEEVVHEPVVRLKHARSIGEGNGE